MEAGGDIPSPEGEGAIPVEVGVTDELKAVKARSGRPQWESNGKERLRRIVRRVAKPLAEAISRDANEADTRMLITDILREGLGYSEYGDLSAEHPVRGEFADYGLRIDQQLVAFVEMKRATTKLGLRHLRQVELYAMHEGVEWVVLTNGADWHVYHLTAGLPIVVDLAFHINLVDEKVSPAQKVDKLFYLSKESMKRRQIDELWRMQAATSPRQLVAALLSKPVLVAVHREVWRRTRERVDEKELAKLLRDTVFRPEALV
ncbi:MAG TPA: hypothetical protein VND96_01535 [Candidatus Micrarchaeaceae archaeon]|nr:hypothetical protein [Candidatus Micrarchaeaceae archaeon]